MCLKLASHFRGKSRKLGGMEAQRMTGQRNLGGRKEGVDYKSPIVITVSRGIYSKLRVLSWNPLLSQ